MEIEIKNIDGVVLFSHECENNTVRKTVEEAVRQGVSLNRANLTKAILYEATVD